MAKVKELTLKEVIDVLCHYNIKHTEFPHNYIAEYLGCPEMFGLHVDGGGLGEERVIYVCKGISTFERRETLLHELLHGREALFDGSPSSEKEIERAAQRQYKDLFVRNKELYRR